MNKLIAIVFWMFSLQWGSAVAAESHSFVRIKETEQAGADGGAFSVGSEERYWNDDAALTKLATVFAARLVNHVKGKFIGIHFYSSNDSHNDFGQGKTTDKAWRISPPEGFVICAIQVANQATNGHADIHILPEIGQDGIYRAYNVQLTTRADDWWGGGASAMVDVFLLAYEQQYVEVDKAHPQGNAVLNFALSQSENYTKMHCPQNRLSAFAGHNSTVSPISVPWTDTPLNLPSEEGVEAHRILECMSLKKRYEAILDEKSCPVVGGAAPRI
nr:hypothetical protein [Burkholderia ambifaria]